MEHSKDYQESKPSAEQIQMPLTEDEKLVLRKKIRRRCEEKMRVLEDPEMEILLEVARKLKVKTTL